MNKFTEQQIEDYVLGRADQNLQDAIQQEADDDPSLKTWLAREEDVLQAISYAGEKELRSTIQKTEDQLYQEGFFLDPDIRQGIDLAGEKELRDTISKVASNMDEKPAARIRRLGTGQILAIAASFLMLIAAAWWFFSQPQTPQDAFATHFEVYQDDLPEKINQELSETGFAGNEKEVLQKFEQALLFYENRAYHEAFQNLYRLNEAYPNHRYLSESYFYQGMSLMNAGRFEEAVTWLGNHFDSFSPQKQNAATWYMGLAYVKMDEQELAEKQFEKLRDHSYYGDSAKEILETIPK